MPLVLNNETYLTIAEAQHYAGDRSPAWLDTRVEAGLLTRYRIGKKPYYKQSELEGALDTSLREAHAPIPPDEGLPPQMYTLPQVAYLLHIGRAYVWKLIHAGKIEAVNIGGEGRAADWRVSPEAYQRFVAEHTSRRRATAPAPRKRRSA